MPDLPPDLAAFLRQHFPPVEKPAPPAWPKPWVPTPGDEEPPF